MLPKPLFILFFLFTALAGEAQNTPKQDSIIDKYLTNGAYKFHYLLQGWNDYIDQALALDSTIALLWQRKALPYWKTGKYELAVQYYNKAVQLDRQQYLGRRGYLKCIFQKNYKEAITDMETAEKEFGYYHQNDHSYQFYIALSYLQLSEFSKAEQILQKDFERTIQKHHEGWIHHLDLFYMGIIKYELRKYNEAIAYFDKSLAKYNHFSDAQFYKGLCFLQTGDKINARLQMLEAQSNFKKGYTINEDDAFYESYPYQVNWHMAKWIIPE